MIFWICSCLPTCEQWYEFETWQMETGRVPLQLLGYILVSVFMYLLETIEKYLGIFFYIHENQSHTSQAIAGAGNIGKVFSHRF